MVLRKGIVNKHTIPFISMLIEISLFSIIFMVLEDASFDIALKAAIVLSLGLRILYKIFGSKKS
jgi:hypothetical protein